MRWFDFDKNKSISSKWTIILIDHFNHKLIRMIREKITSCNHQCWFDYIWFADKSPSFDNSFTKKRERNIHQFSGEKRNNYLLYLINTKDCLDLYWDHQSCNVHYHCLENRVVHRFGNNIDNSSSTKRTQYLNISMKFSSLH